MTFNRERWVHRTVTAGEQDSLGKDSELAATLAQGKPVIAYVPAHAQDERRRGRLDRRADIFRVDHPLGLQMISVHMPRYEADTDLDTVNEAMEENRITEPTAVDSLHKLKDAFLNEQGWVPVYYLFDADGKLKTRAAGEYGIGVLTTVLDKMFAAHTAAA